MRGRPLVAFLCVLAASAATAAPPDFVERFDGGAASFAQRWNVSDGLDPALHEARVRALRDADGRPYLHVRVEAGDALDRPDGAIVCDASGSIAARIRAAGKPVASERVEIELRADHRTGADEVVRFGRPVWYRFAFRVDADNPRDAPVAGREDCRTVVHQVKQNSGRDGVPCSASPFFKVEARPAGADVHVFAQVAAGAACAGGRTVARTRLCDATRATGSWVDVRVRLLPALDAGGELDMWLDGVPCARFRGAMGDPVDGARRADGAYVDVQPRFGIYRDRRAEAQGLALRDVAVWTGDPSGSPEWGLARARID